MKIYVNDIFKIFNIEKTQLNVTAVKALIAAMSMNVNVNLFCSFMTKTYVGLCQSVLW